MSTITDALRAARACIQQDRTILADTGMRHDNTMEPDAAAGVAEYDAVLQQIDAALAGEQPVSPDLSRWCVYVAGMISGWLEMARPQIMSMGDEARTQAIAGIIERRLWALPKNTAPAPAVPCDPTQQVRPYEPTEQMRWAMKRIDPALTHDQCRALWSAAWSAAPTPPAQSKCLTCNGHGLIGGHMQDGSGYGEGCPDCNPEPAVPESADDAQIRAIGEALLSAHEHIEMHKLERSHCKDAERIREGLAAFSAYRKRGDFVPSPAVPEDVTREPMTQRWCWWIGDAETFDIADTESEAHGEARFRIDYDCEPGDTREYSVGRVQHPIDALGVDWLADHVAETIEENTREWCDDNTGAEDQSITLAAEDRKVLGTMVAAFLREKAAVHWWTADQKTITTHTYVAGSSDDAEAARAAEKGGE